MIAVLCASALWISTCLTSVVGVVLKRPFVSRGFYFANFDLVVYTLQGAALRRPGPKPISPTPTSRYERIPSSTLVHFPNKYEESLLVTRKSF